MKYGHVPEENLEEYRRLMWISRWLTGQGNSLSGRNMFLEAESCWAVARRYRENAQKLRTVIDE